ncbi:MAG: NAD(P)H-dependent oxidoreductase [Spirochaetaceae bacterium]|jgi:NAD(P)H dehydrogenase (quinone)|nr:NAD(P)H-dependent oxidoreductase [Spirochaetaceae bacterium]
MNSMIVLAHPSRESLNYSLYQGLCNKIQRQDLFPHDLYREDFPCILPVEEIQRGISTDDLIGQHQRELIQSDRIILLYPDWWSMPPAILKGWLDRVLTAEVAYSWQGEEFMEKNKNPLLKGKKIHIIVTADGALDFYWLKKLWGEKIWGYCGAEAKLYLFDNLKDQPYKSVQKQMQAILSGLLVE